MADTEGTGAQIRRRFRDLEPNESDSSPNKAFAEYVSLGSATPMGHFELTADTTPVGLPSLPPNCKRAVLYAVDNSFVYTDDGTPPSATHGMPIPAEIHFIYDTDPDENFLVYSALGTEIRIAYYG